MDDIQGRKADHLVIASTKPITMSRSAGFDAVELIHHALPEVDLDRISLATTFLGHRLSAPILVSSMTGGTDRGREINRHLGEAIHELGLAMAVGSQRVMLENPSTLPTFRVVREVAPNALVLGNLGAVQLNYGMGAQEILHAADAIDANGMFLHLNPLQEAVQPEGNTNFFGLLDKIEDLANRLPMPLLVKEVGSGISPDIAMALAARRIQAIDVSGAGGTSWAHIEGLRTTDPGRQRMARLFSNWGIPTVTSLRECRRRLPQFPLIASGGIRSGLDMAKAVALGADLVGVAHLLLDPAMQSTEAVISALQQWIWELRVSMFLVGAANLNELKGRYQISDVIQ